MRIEIKNPRPEAERGHVMLARHLQVVIDGVDITNHVTGLKLTGDMDSLVGVELSLVPSEVFVDVDADVRALIEGLPAPDPAPAIHVTVNTEDVLRELSKRLSLQGLHLR